jgi:hypothetical protein
MRLIEGRKEQNEGCMMDRYVRNWMGERMDRKAMGIDMNFRMHQHGSVATAQQSKQERHIGMNLHVCK